MKTISFFLCYLFCIFQFNADASASLKDFKIYYLEVIDIPKKSVTVKIIDRDERANLEKTNFDDFGKLMRVPVMITANQKYQFGEHILEENDQIIICYHFNSYKMIETLDKKPFMTLPKEFKPMTEWQAVLNFVNALGDTKFTADDDIKAVIAYMNQPEREHRKKQYLGNWVEPLFLRKKT